MADKKTYVGRLACDGKGNLLACEEKRVGTRLVQVHDENGEPVYDEAGNEIVLEVPAFKYGKNHGRRVAHDKTTDTYVFLDDDAPSHNDQHHEQFVEMTGTHTQEDATDHPGFAGTPDKPIEGREHHWGPLPDDPHYSEGATDDLGNVTNVAVINDNDKDAVVASSHTEQPREAA